MVLYKIRMWEQAKTMDLDKLKRDMFNDPQLMYLNSMAPEELAEHLVEVHLAMMRGEYGIFGYLYRQQTLKLRER